MPEGEKETNDKIIPNDRVSFINKHFCPDNGDAAMYSVTVDLTFEFEEINRPNRIHIVRVDWEDNDSITGLDSRGGKHLLYGFKGGKIVEPSKILREYHNGNLRTFLFNHLAAY
jgi:hypothetical protein